MRDSRRRSVGEPATMDWFLAWVEKTETCWMWTGARGSKGYGAAWRGGNIGAHRLAWELANGREVPDGLCVLHHCDTPACVRPDHLFLGSHASNAADRNSKGRQAHGERNAAAKLTTAQAAEIRRLSASGVNGCALARQFGVCRSTIWGLLKGHTWLARARCLTAPVTALSPRALAIEAGARHA